MLKRPNRVLSLLIALILIAGYAARDYLAEGPSAAEYVYGGWPKPLHLSLDSWTRVFRNRGYAVGYSEWRREPLWAGFVLEKPLELKRTAARGAFHSDPRSFFQVSPEDYMQSGYDRGHLAPNHAIGLVFGAYAQRETFFMTNVCPQSPPLNQKLWERLEEATTDVFMPTFGHLWVLTGPIFPAEPRRLPSGIQIPDAFFKIFLVERTGSQPQVLAFVMPQEVTGHEPLDRYLDTVDDIEARTGFDFFPEMERDLQASVESTINRAGWSLDRAARIATHD